MLYTGVLFSGQRAQVLQHPKYFCSVQNAMLVLTFKDANIQEEEIVYFSG